MYAQLNSQPQPDNLAVQIANVAGPAWGSAPIALPGTNTDFQLTSSGTDKQPIAQINADSASNVWNAAPTAREDLAASFDQMRIGLETLEKTQKLGLGAAYSIVQRVAEALPLGYSEILGYRYGLDAGTRSVDLSPGMRLRVEHATGEYSSPLSDFNGFTGSGATYWTVDRRRADQALTFDPFFGSLRVYPPTSDKAGGWGLVTAQTAGSFPRIRLMFPAIPSGGSAFGPWPGSALPAQNVTLIGACSTEDIETASAAYVAGGSIPTDGKDGTIAVTFFRGRAVVVPELPIRVNDTYVYAPIGTTMRNLAERFVTAGFNPAGITCGRVFTWTGTNTSKPAWVTITGLTDGAFPNGADAWDLPVVKGDQITLS